MTAKGGCKEQKQIPEGDDRKKGKGKGQCGGPSPGLQDDGERPQRS
jgi:hypothetical protein